MVSPSSISRSILMEEMIKMAVYGYNELQTIQPGASALLNDITPCNRGLVIHRPGSGVLSLRGSSGNPCNRFARYRVSYSCNIALPEGATPGEIQVALAIGGELIPLSTAAATPTAVDAFWNVHSVADIDVPLCCCDTVSLNNASVSATPATTPAPVIQMRNLVIEVQRTA